MITSERPSPVSSIRVTIAIFLAPKTVSWFMLPKTLSISSAVRISMTFLVNLGGFIFSRRCSSV